MRHYTKRPAAWMIPTVLCTTLPTITQAQTGASSTGHQATTELSPVVVTATRNKSTVGETPQNVTIITREQIERQLAITNDPGQVLSNLIPSYSPSRQKMSNAGETLRGRSPLILVDGVPQTNPLRNVSRDTYTVDLSMVERIEVIHGASAEHGLGASGGIINFVTKRPESGTVNQHVGVSLTSADNFDSEGLGYKLNYSLSGVSGDWDYLAAATLQERGVFFDANDERVGIAYPGEIQNSTSYDLLAKLGYWIDANQNIELSLNHFKLENNGGYVPVPGDRDAGVPTTARKGDQIGKPGFNKVTTARLAYTHDDWFGNRVDAQVYYQRFRALFATTPYFPYVDENGDTRFDQTRAESNKVGANFTLSRDGLLDDHLKLTTGIDLLQDETRQMLVHIGRPYVPEIQYRSYAAFLQGDLDLTDWLSLHAGVRHVRAELKVDDFSTVDRTIADGDPEDASEDLVNVDGGSPGFNETLFNVGTVLQLTDWAQLYANYSQGFGMPDVGRVLRGIETPGLDVDTLLKLQPIVTESREIGARFDWDRYSLELSYYESESDFGSRLTEKNGVWVVKREKTEIQGYVITGEARPNDTHRLWLSYAHAEGKSDTDGDGQVDTELTGINIAPDTLRLAWSAAWTEKLSTYLQYKHYFDRSIGNPKLEFDGYGLVDASLIYQLPVGRVRLGIANLTNEDYFTYYSQSARVSDAYYFKGRGRTFTVGYQVDF